MIAIYTRQSIDKKDSISIETQVEMCQKEIKNQGLEFKIYKDKGFSGKNTDRPAFQNLMADVKQGNIDTIVVYRLDRISRSVLDFANIIDILQKHNVSFISASEKFDTSTPVGKAMLYIVMVFAQLERETIAERVKDNYYQRGETGAWGGGIAPFGYSNTKTTINGKRIATIQQNNDIELVKQIFCEYANTDKSLGNIASELTAKLNEMWNNIKLSRMLHNPAYVQADVDIYNYYVAKGCVIESDVSLFNGVNGLNVYGKRDRGANKYNNLKDHHIAVGFHSGVIPSDLWLKCQYKLDKNIQIKNNGKGKHTWLTGLIKCGYCGRAMTVKIYKETKYFNCSGRAIKMCDAEVVTHYVSDIEELVHQKMINYVDNFSDCKIKDIENDNRQEINSLKAELVQIEKDIENIVNNLTVANTTLMEYANKKIEELDNKKKQTLDKINKLNVTKDVELKIPNLDGWDSWDIEAKRDVAKTLIDKVYVYKDRIHIKWAY